MASVSVSSLILRVRDLLPAGDWETTGTAADGSTTSITVPDGTRWSEGDVGEFQDNGEQVLVRSVAGNTLTVKRGHAGTTSQSHSGAVLVKNPTYTWRQIEQALYAAVRSLWPYAWKTETIAITPSTTAVWYDATATAVDLVRATQRYGDSNQYLGTFGARGSGKPIVFEKNLDTALVPSGKGFRFPGGFFHPTNQVKAVMRAVITGTNDIADDPDLPVADVVVYGAAARLLESRQVDRVSLPPRAEEGASISDTAALRTGAYYRQLFMDGLRQLKLLHEAKWPPAGVARR